LIHAKICGKVRLLARTKRTASSIGRASDS
jgi:hypothetical protein